MEYVVHLGDMSKVMVCMVVRLTLKSPLGVLKSLLERKRDQKEEEDVQD